MKKKRTKLIRENVSQTSLREHSEGLFLSSSFTFPDAETAAEKFAETAADYIYSRFSNPTVSALAHRLAVLEGGEAALCVASGMAAILATIIGVCQAGDKIVCAANSFGATIQLLNKIITKFSITVEYVNSSDSNEWAQAITSDTALVLVESPSNPMLEVVDIAALAALAKKVNAVLAVDNCFCPYGQTPLTLGADVVIHSATKYLDGQGRVLGGAIVGGEEILYEKIYPFLRSGGPALSPFNAWVTLKGLETLALRMRAHSEAALTIAAGLEEQPQVEKVFYCGLQSHPQHDLAMQQQSGLGGGIVTLRIKGGRDNAWRFMNKLQCFSITSNFGDTKSTITHPATTTHAKVTTDMRKILGISDNMIRLSIGLEDVEDLQNDLLQSLAS